MISPDEFLAYLCKLEGGTVAVDLLKLGNAATRQSGGSQGGKSSAGTSAAAKIPAGPKLRLALDMEDCLDRFYGGYYSDWACGGQWNRAYQFVQLLVVAFQKAHIEITALFDGTLREHKRWTQERIDTRERTLAVLKHIRTIGTPPPKVWWMPPGGLRTALRNAMRALNIPTVQTVNDHSMEVVAYYQQEGLDGVLGLSADYVVANVSRFFSSHDLRLSYKGTLESKEFLISKLLTNFSLTPDHLPFMAALFGGYTLLTEATLRRIYKKLRVAYADDSETRLRRIAEIVRNSPTNDLAEFINKLELQEWQEELRETIEYYQRRGKFASGKIHFRKRVQIETAFASSATAKQGGKSPAGNAAATKATAVEDVVALASETNENDEMARKILLDVNNLVDEGETDAPEEAEASEKATATATTVEKKPKGAKGNKNQQQQQQNSGNFVYTLPSEILKTALLRHQRGMMDPRIFHLFNKKEIFLPQLLEDEQYREVPSVHLFYRPARQLVYAILFNLFHQRYMYAKTAKDQQKGGTRRENAGKPEILIREWIWSPQNEYARPELVPAEQLPWSVSTIQRLWFGMAVEDKQRRMKAFLTVLRSDTPLMMNRSCVPQHMLVLACVLRYIVTNPDRSVLTHSELDAFLATALSPCLANVEYTQEMVLPGVNLRGVYLATLLMQGFETASLANDACGVPLPWLSTSPWLVFDGKLFQLKLKMTGCVQSLLELCDDHLETVLKIERLKKAILEDAEHFLLPDPMAFRGNFDLGGPVGNFSGIPLPLLQSVAAANGGAGGAADFYSGPLGPRAPFMGAPNAPKGTARGPLNNRPLNPMMRATGMQGLNAAVSGAQQPKGHHLKVGGVVVGSWGSGYGGRQQQQAAHHSELAQLSTRYNQVGRGRNVASQMLSNRLSRMQLEMHLPHIGQYAPHAYGGGVGPLHRGAFNMRGLGGGFAGGAAGIGGGYGGMLGKSLKAGAGVAKKGKAANRQSNLKKQTTAAAATKKKNNKRKEQQATNKGKTAAGGGGKTGEVADLGEMLTTKLKVAGEEGNDEKEMKNGSSRLLDSNLVAEMCDGLLKEDDEDELLDNDDDEDEDDDNVRPKSKGQPKHVLTKKKLIAIGVASQEKRESLNGGSTNKAEAGQGDAAA